MIGDKRKTEAADCIAIRRGALGGERSGSGRWKVTETGATRSENADMSSDKVR